MAIETEPKKTGLLVGGSGLIGGAITYYFKTHASDSLTLVAPNSKKLSLRVPDDIKQYFKKIKPDFIINAAIAAIDSDPLLSFETNYIGAINLAKLAAQLKIPYIHFSSSATMPSGLDLSEEDQLTLSPGLGNYAKSKLMAEMTLRHLHETEGLDYTTIRLAVVYGKHDHKIQGFHRLFFSIVDQAIPFMLTKPGVQHSYTNTKKIAPFIHYLLDHRAEFSGQTYNFVDPEPVALASIILTIKRYLQLSLPKEIYIPYPVANFFKTILKWIMKKLSIISIEARMPAELMFLENFYRSQTLSSAKLANSSYGLPQAEVTIFTELPSIIEYYLTRWEHLNLISSFNESFYHPQTLSEEFAANPEELIKLIHAKKIDPRYGFCLFPGKDSH
jgi:nucleoside-diphosphate-sugar epimerase